MKPASFETRPARVHHHGHSLAEDLARIDHLQRRRRALAWMASSAGSLLLAGCGGGGDGGTSTTSASTTASTTALTTGTTSTTGSTTTTTTTTSSSACIADPQETAGPYPADGTNTASGATSDILTATGIVRSDIRSSFIGSSTTTAPGVPMTLVLTLVNTNSVCSTLQGYAIYLWHCDRAGNYSLYTAAAESWLRGVQVTDSSGKVTFTTIVPGCYDGRWPHMHFEVFPSLSVATTGRNAVLTSQLALPAAVANAVYPTATGYSASVTNFARVSIASDNVFGDNTAAQIAAMTPTMTGNATDGYQATATIGVAR